MPSKFFDRFPRVPYDILGDGNKKSVPNISYTISISENSEEEVIAYTKYIIKDGDRPDTVSQELYGSPNYYWTFYVLNDTLREYGWPPGRRDMYSWVKANNPGWRLQVNENEARTLNNRFILGETIRGESNCAKGVITKKETIVKNFKSSYIQIDVADETINAANNNKNENESTEENLKCVILEDNQRWVGETSGDVVEKVIPVEVIKWKENVDALSILDVEMERHVNYYTQIRIIRPEHIRLVSSLYARL